LLSVKHALRYRRLADALPLKVLTSAYLAALEDECSPEQPTDYLPADLVAEIGFASSDKDDRQIEVTGAIKLIASLASVDGLVWLDPLLRVRGFGVKIGDVQLAKPVYAGNDLLAGECTEHRALHELDATRFGTRHGSMLRFCGNDPDAIGVVVSQDGQVRMIMTVRRQLVLWDGVRVTNYVDDLLAYRNMRAEHAREVREMRKHGAETEIGYTSLPTTLDELVRVR
jgi:hypothetical protein